MYFMFFFCFFFFFFQSIVRLPGLFSSNEVFYQSDCELVTFDTVELFFLRKEYIYILSRGGVHLIVSVTVILNSKVVSIKMF